MESLTDPILAMIADLIAAATVAMPDTAPHPLEITTQNAPLLLNLEYPLEELVKIQTPQNNSERSKVFKIVLCGTIKWLIASGASKRLRTIYIVSRYDSSLHVWKWSILGGHGVKSFRRVQSVSTNSCFVKF